MARRKVGLIHGAVWLGLTWSSCTGLMIVPKNEECCDESSEEQHDLVMLMEDI